MSKHLLSTIVCMILLFPEHPKAGSLCALKWNYDRSKRHDIDFKKKCPYGTRLIGDVTLPNNSTIPDYISVMYGYVPHLVIGLGILELVLKGVSFHRNAPHFTCRPLGTREVSFVGFCLFIVILNEFILKRIVNQPRPDKSCNHTCGFPSGHSTMAVGFYTLMFLDGVFRILPKIPMTLAEADHEARKHRSRTSFDPHARSGMWRLLTMVPLSAKDVMSHFEFAFFCSVWTILLLPVPTSRLALHDHTTAQVLTGCAIGGFEAVVWFILTRRGQQRWNPYLGQTVCKILHHNYALPRFEVKSKCVRLLARCRYVNVHEILEELQVMRDEITWYLKFTSNRQQHILAAVRDAEGYASSWLRHDYAAEMNFLDFECHDLGRLQKLIEEKLYEATGSASTRSRKSELSARTKSELSVRTSGTAPRKRTELSGSLEMAGKRTELSSSLEMSEGHTFREPMPSWGDGMLGSMSLGSTPEPHSPNLIKKPFSLGSTPEPLSPKLIKKPPRNRNREAAQSSESALPTESDPTMQESALPPENDTSREAQQSLESALPTESDPTMQESALPPESDTSRPATTSSVVEAENF